MDERTSFAAILAASLAAAFPAHPFKGRGGVPASAIEWEGDEAGFFWVLEGDESGYLLLEGDEA